MESGNEERFLKWITDTLSGWQIPTVTVFLVTLHRNGNFLLCTHLNVNLLSDSECSQTRITEFIHRFPLLGWSCVAAGWMAAGAEVANFTAPLPRSSWLVCENVTSLSVPLPPLPAPHSPVSSTTATCSSAGNLTPLCESRRAVAEYVYHKLIATSTIPNTSIDVAT